jgi:hypothetical protein
MWTLFFQVKYLLFCWVFYSERPAWAYFPISEWSHLLWAVRMVSFSAYTLADPVNFDLFWYPLHNIGLNSTHLTVCYFFEDIFVVITWIECGTVQHLIQNDAQRPNIDSICIALVFSLFGSDIFFGPSQRLHNELLSRQSEVCDFNLRQLVFE